MGNILHFDRFPELEELKIKIETELEKKFNPIQVYSTRSIPGDKSCTYSWWYLDKEVADLTGLANVKENLRITLNPLYNTNQWDLEHTCSPDSTNQIMQYRRDIILRDKRTAQDMYVTIEEKLSNSLGNPIKRIDDVLIWYIQRINQFQEATHS
ncbi:MAG: hypothetical protein AABX10_02305 [Nanoarchaeota archaeon]